MDFDGPGSSGSGRDALTAVVVEQQPSALYLLKLEDGSRVTAHVADRMDRNFVRLLVGDQVRVELSPMDRGRGRIVGKL